MDQGSSARIERQVGTVDRDGLQGAKRSNSRSCCEHWQRRRPPEPADAHADARGTVIGAEDPYASPRAMRSRSRLWIRCMSMAARAAAASWRRMAL
ncbi:hypothetical protein EAG14_03450 [Acidovorax sp. 1608163]|nr:hypothetical protein EAG14_03450 [Acidovorax sp. 1608163]